MIKARPLSCSVIDCFGLGAASLIALLNTDWTSAQNFQPLHANYISGLYEANRHANVKVKTIRVIITNLHMPNVAYDTPVYQSYIRHALYDSQTARSRGSDPFVWNFNICIVV